MAYKVKLYTLEDDDESSMFFDKIAGVEGESYISQRVRLEDRDYLDQNFDFWNPEDGQLIWQKFECLSTIFNFVYAIYFQNNKHQQIQDVEFEQNLANVFFDLGQDFDLHPFSNNRVS